MAATSDAAPAANSGGAPGGDGAGGRATGARDHHQRRDVGVPLDRRLPRADLAGAPAPSTVQGLLRRVGLATRRARLTVLEQQAARTAGLLTERKRQRL